MTAVLGTLEKRVGRLEREVCRCGVPSVSGPTADPEHQDNPARSHCARWPSPRRVPVLNNRCNAGGSALDILRLPRVLRTVLPGAVQGSLVACLTFSGQGNHVKTTRRT